MDIGKIKQLRGVSGGSRVSVLLLDRKLVALKNAIVELGEAVSKGEPNDSQRAHLSAFWDIVGGVK